MKTKWKNHELLLATMATAVIIAGYIGQSKTGLELPLRRIMFPSIYSEMSSDRKSE